MDIIFIIYAFFTIGFLGFLAAFYFRISIQGMLSGKPFLVAAVLSKKSSVAVGVNKTIFRDALLSVLKKMNIQFEENIWGFKLIEQKLEIKIAINETLGLANLKINNTSTNKGLLNQLNNNLNAYFQERDVSIKPIFTFLHFLGGLFFFVLTLVTFCFTLMKYQSFQHAYPQSISRTNSSNENLAEHYFQISRTHESKGEYEKAVQAVSQTIQLNPKRSNAYYNRGVYYQKLGNLDSAIADYERALKDGENQLAYFNRAIIYKKKGEYEKALKDINKAIEMNSADFRFYNQRAHIYNYIDKPDLAILDANRALELNPTNPCACSYFYRAYAYSSLQKYDEAILDLNKAIEIDPHVSYYNNRGWAYAMKGDYPTAIKDTNKAIEVDFKFIRAHFNLGLILYLHDQFDQSYEQYKKALSYKLSFNKGYDDFIKYAPQQKSTDSKNIHRAILDLLKNNPV